ncbi:MAG TPA: VTT domain-containing protein [Acidisarcina sp.]|nr:VTT domain-containing protein [Acidisarcina sp.]
MPAGLDFVIQYGYLILFVWVLVEMLGMPIPSTPLLLAAGTLTATHRLSLVLVVLAVTAGCLVADTTWYLLGKRYGGAMVRLVCRLSLEASTCVRRTEDYFGKHGLKSLLVAKFIPGLTTLAAPIAGQSKMPYRSFLLFDFMGSLIWTLALTLSGRFFGDVVKHNPAAMSWVRNSFAAMVLLAVLALVLYRIMRQQAFLRELRNSRLEPEELKRLIDEGEPVYIVDLRHPLDYLPDPRVLPGAVRYTSASLLENSGDIPRDRDIVLYCTCPSEATAAKTAMSIRKLGIQRVRPLRGGFDGWKNLGFPLVDAAEETAGSKEVAS